MFEKIRRFLTYNCGTEKLLEKLAGCDVEVLDEHSAIVTGYQCQMDIMFDDFKWGIVLN